MKCHQSCLLLLVLSSFVLGAVLARGPVNVRLNHIAVDAKTNPEQLHPNLGMLKWYSQMPPDVPLGGNIYPLGIFFMNADVGTPSLTYKVALDTGSADLVIPLKGCVGCHLQNTSSYNPAASSTSKPVGCSESWCNKCTAGQCAFFNSYETCNLTDPTQPCSVGGPIFSDVVTLGGLSTQGVFGAIATQTANFQQFYVIDGVIGFCDPPSIGTKTTFERLYDAGQLKQNIFSVCLNSPETYPKSGVITLGGIDPNLHVGGIQYTPDVGGGNFYEIEMTNIKLNGVDIGVPWLQYVTTIIDSGTNTLLLNTPTFQALKTSFLNLCSTQKLPGICTGNSSHTLFDNFCFTLTDKDIFNFPPIQLIINNQIPLTIKGIDYLLPEPQTNNKPGFRAGPQNYCLGILPTGEGGFTIIGDVVMKNYYFIFDRGNSQIGFSPVNRANCLAS